MEEINKNCTTMLKEPESLVEYSEEGKTHEVDKKW